MSELIYRIEVLRDADGSISTYCVSADGKECIGGDDSVTPAGALAELCATMIKVDEDKAIERRALKAGLDDVANGRVTPLDDILRDLQASPSPQTPRGWQPMESAPKDGTSVLLAYKISGLDSVTVGWFNGTRWRDEEDIHLGPSHWMPLPAPPVSAPPASSEGSK